MPTDMLRYSYRRHLALLVAARASNLDLEASHAEDAVSSPPAAFKQLLRPRWLDSRELCVPAEAKRNDERQL